MAAEVLEKPQHLDYNRIDTHTKSQIINLTVEGKPQKEIANQLSVDQATVSRALNKPENRTLIQKLKERLQKKYATRFVVRKIREEQRALNLSDYAHNPSTITNKTIYQTPEQIESYLARQDKSGLKMLQGTDILSLHTNQFNFQSNQQVNIEPAIMSLFSLGEGGFNDSMEVVDMEEVNSNDKS